MNIKKNELIWYTSLRHRTFVKLLTIGGEIWFSSGMMIKLLKINSYFVSLTMFFIWVCAKLVSFNSYCNQSVAGLATVCININKTLVHILWPFLWVILVQRSQLYLTIWVHEPGCNNHMWCFIKSGISSKAFL